MSESTARLLRDRAASTELWIDVQGPSMRPTIAEPASVRVERADAPRPGEVWAFVGLDGSVVVHRCLRRFTRDAYGFRGDGVARDDPPVSGRRLVGRVTHVRDARGTRRVRRSPRRVVAAQLRRGSKFTQRGGGR